MVKKAEQHLTFIDFLARKINESGRPLAEIAEGIGYENEHMLKATLMAKLKTPVDRVFPTAKFFDVDPAYLMRLYIRDCLPEFERAIFDCEGSMIVTQRERLLLEAYRKSTADADPQVLLFEDKRVVALAIS